MTELLTAARMRAIEEAAIEGGRVTGLELMEHAGAGVLEAVLDEWPDLGAAPHRAVVLCGPGNNGGDGFVVARLLKERGWAVEVFAYGDQARLPPDALAARELWAAAGEIGDWVNYATRQDWGCDLLVDALFGTGLGRGLPELGGLFREMADAVGSGAIEAGNASGRPAIVAIDMPSGICSDSGRLFPQGDPRNRDCASAHLTVTFHLAKAGHFLADGPDHCGKLVVKDIGLGASASVGTRLVTVPSPGRIAKTSSDHKYAHGHALILGGGPGQGGAARLAARGALRIGAGLVTLGCPPQALPENAARLEAIMLKPIATAVALAGALEDRRINALCLGPGLGMEAARELVPVALAALRPTVLDADALTAFAGDPEALFGLLHDNCVLTPHAGEFARLFPDIAERLVAPAVKGPAYSKVDAARAAATRAGAVMLFKGPDTVIAAPDGQCSLNAAAYGRGAPWLATAGSGDVLAGFIAGLLARRFPPVQAAETAAWLHVDCALDFGPGLIAEDLPEMLPGVLRRSLIGAN